MPYTADPADATQPTDDVKARYAAADLRALKARVNGIVSGTVVTGAVGQCLLTYVSATQLKLAPYKGNQLTIGGVNYTIPSAGVTVDNSGLSASTNYYVYAYVSAGAIVLEKSTTVRATDTITGQEIKTGDATRTLVGLVRANGSSQFANSPANRWVRSWFNEPSVAGAATLGANTGVGAAPWVEITSNLRIDGVFWGGEVIRVNGGFSAYDASGTATPTFYASSNLDGANGGRQSTASIAAGQVATGNFGALFTSTEGYHYIAIFGGQSGGTSPQYLSGYTGHEYATLRA